jgi:hypothetical protein
VLSIKHAYRLIHNSNRDKRNLPSFPIWRAFYRTFRYHLGSLAFGSLLVAIVQFIRVLFYQSQKQLQSMFGDHPAFKCVVCCVDCCLVCLEKFIMFINRNAYIEIAIYGKGFCQSASSVFGLLVRNAFRLIAVSGVTAFILFTCKVAITATVTAGAYVAIRQYNFGLRNIGLPLTIVAVMAWILSSCLLSVYRMAIDTIFVSYCEDCERNDGSPQKPYYMSKQLQSILGVHNEAPELEIVTTKVSS